MLRKQSMKGRSQFAMITIDGLVPKDHLVQKIDADFDFIYPIIESTYLTIGCPSIDPVVLIKLVFIQCNEILSFSTITRDGYREYKSNPKKRKVCPLLKSYSRSVNFQKVVTRHI